MLVLAVDLLAVLQLLLTLGLSSAEHKTTGYSFGLGETSVACHYAVDGNWGNGGGGGGFYGGFASGYTTGAYTNGGGAGGSGYIGNSLLNEKTMYCYNCTESSETSTKTISTTCVNSNQLRIVLNPETDMHVLL